MKKRSRKNKTIVNKNKAKHNSQQKMLETIDRLFLAKIRKRTLLLNNPVLFNKKDIIGLDLQISELIKKRARLTRDGYNYIQEKMWEWKPSFPIDESLMPKTIK